jgi:hypothetical protein
MPRVRKGEAVKGVDDVLSELGIDMDLSPEDATHDFMKTTESSMTPIKKPGVGGDDEEEDGGDDDDDSDDEGGDDEEEDNAASPIPRESSFFPPIPAPPAPSKPKSAPKLAAVASIPDPDFEPEPLPFIAPPPPPPTPIKGKARVNPPSTSRLGKGLAAKVPGAERIKVYKRQDSGQLGHIGDYRARDLEGCVDIEDFIARYVKPKFGAGEYQLKGIDSYGREMEVGSVFMLDPPGVSEAGGAFGLAQSLMAQQREFMREQLARAQQPAAPAQDPITMLRNVMALSDSVTQKAKEEKERGAAEMNGNMSSMMQMFMMMQQQSQQQMAQMMTLLATPREDPVMKMLLAKLVEDKTSSRGGDALPPPPPPPPLADPMEGISKLIMALASAGLIGNHGGGGDDEVKEMLKAQIQARESERLTFKDVIGMMQEMRQERGTDDFKKSADNLAMMLSITNQLRQSTEGGATAGFFDALAALFGNRDFAGSIAGAIRSKATTTQQQQLVAQNQQTVIQQRALAQAALQRQQIINEAQRSLQQSPPPVAQPIAASAPQPATAQPTAPAQTASAPAQTASAPVQTASAPAPAPVRRPQIQLPPLPANTSDHINNLIQATDDAGLMAACVSLLMYLSEFPDWTNFTTKLLGAAQNGNKREMLQYLAILFEGFVGMGLLELEVAKRVLSAANQHFDVIHAKLGNDGSGGVIPEEEEEEEIDFLRLDDEDDENGGGFDTAQA